MDSERLNRYKQSRWDENELEINQKDDLFASRIRALLNHPAIHEYSMVDAYYYDFSVLPEWAKDKFYRDMYLLYGITHEGEFVTKWIERWDLDSDKPIVKGEIKNENTTLV